MKNIIAFSVLAYVAVSATGFANAAKPGNASDLIPERAVVLMGNPRSADDEVLEVFYSREDLAFNDPDAPRFLLLDRKGSIAFGIGGQLYATASYDFDGAIPSPNFTTYNIDVPNNPADRQRFGADLSHSSLFMKLVGKTRRFGQFSVYFQSNFTGDNGGYGFKLKQAYVTLGHLTAGKTNSTFVDGASQAPTIDTEGPSGQIADKNILFRYTTPAYKGLKGAVSIEVPQASYTLGTGTQGIPQRVPDIPAYLQYSWAPGLHVRASAIFRDLAYRDILHGENRLQVGWGLQLSTIANLDPAGFLQLFGHVAYGKGIGQYINDLGGNGFDLVAGDKPGELVAPRQMGWAAGLYINPTSRLQITSCFSRAQTYNLHRLGGDTYRYGQYVDANAFYSLDSNCKIGAEYLHGWRKNYDGTSGHANRINLLLQYSF